MAWETSGTRLRWPYAASSHAGCGSDQERHGGLQRASPVHDLGGGCTLRSLMEGCALSWHVRVALRLAVALNPLRSQLEEAQRCG